MDKLFYPAIFHTEDNGFWVSFPDIPECLTEGDDINSAYSMAVDALGLALTSRIKEGEPLPSPSNPSSITADDGSVVIIAFDMIAYSKKENAKSVKKTLTIPEWLNDGAIAMNINFSQVLQEALIEKLSIR